MYESFVHTLKQKQELVYLYIFGHSIKYEKHVQSFSAVYKKERIFLGKEASHFAYDHISAPFISQ